MQQADHGAGHRIFGRQTIRGPDRPAHRCRPSIAGQSSPAIHEGRRSLADADDRQNSPMRPWLSASAGAGQSESVGRY